MGMGLMEGEMQPANNSSFVEKTEKTYKSDNIKIAHDIAEALIEKGMITGAVTPRYRRVLDVADVIIKKLDNWN